mmetsp:Transcript_38428/g.121449  ORF Transcript_38428/g.121449 Transcript_38428/m.121449 type:complete len:236 (-) Transcript_38428:138-845(-)
MEASTFLGMSWVVDPTVKAVLGNLGTATATLMFCSPAKTFAYIMRKKSTESYDGMPYCMGVLQCAVWVFYALPFITPDRFAPLLTNVIGASVQLAFALIFLTYATDSNRHLMQLAMCVGSLLVLSGVVMFLPSQEERSTFLGLVASGLCVALYASPLGAIAEVFRTRSVKYMPFMLSAAMFGNSLVWILYSVYVLDYYVLVPNVLGWGLSCLQLGVYFYFRDGGEERAAGYSRIA